MNSTQSPAVATHTPTPYEVAYYSPDKSIGDQSAFIIMPQFGTMNDGKAICSGHGPDHKANSAFIVRACNSHAQLVEALEGAVAEMKDQLDHLTQLGDITSSDGRLSPIYAGGIYHRHMQEAISKARAALQSAKE